ncbi:kelch repeat-containing protein [soil metagenome]
MNPLCLLVGLTPLLLFPSDPVVIQEPGLAPGRWLRLANMQTPHEYHASAVFDGRILVVGGNNQAAFEEYNPASNSWKLLPALPTPRVFLGAAAVGKHLFAVGGLTRDNKTSALNELFDFETQKWSRLADLPTLRDRLAVVVLGKRIFVIGGMNERGNLAAVEEYDPAQDRWLRRADLLIARHGHAASVVGDKILVSGGHGPTGDQLDSTEEYDPKLDRWIRRANMPIACSFHCMTTVENFVYALGGRVRGRPPVLAYDVAKNTWTRAGFMPGTTRDRFGAAVSGSKIFILGGELQEDRQLPISALSYEPKVEAK